MASVGFGLACAERTAGSAKNRESDVLAPRGVCGRGGTDWEGVWTVFSYRAVKAITFTKCAVAMDIRLDPTNHHLLNDTAQNSGLQ